MTTYSKPINCPECGQETYELYHALNGVKVSSIEDFHFMLTQSVPQKVLMCDACYEDSEMREN